MGTAYITLSKNAADMVGRSFGRLTVLGPVAIQTPSGRPGRRGGKVVWECRCLCGTIVRITGQSLRDGASQSCGCWRREATRKTRSNLPNKDITQAQDSRALLRRRLAAKYGVEL